MRRRPFQTHIIPLDLGPLAQRAQQAAACCAARIATTFPEACYSLVGQALIPCAGCLKQQRMWYHIGGQQRGLALHTRNRLRTDIDWLEQVLVLALGAHEATLGNRERWDRASIWRQGLSRVASSCFCHGACAAVMLGHGNKYVVGRLR